MAVKIKSKKPVKTKEVVCPKCGFLLEYTGEDVTEYTKTDYGGGTDTYHYITCPRPSCKEEINV